jgi:CheY-like chemotaxis protein
MANTILTIEDHGDIRRLIRLTLEYRDYQVLEAADGVQGLAMARQHRPDLILLDVMMPGLDGLSVAETLATDPALNVLPVVMLSARGAVADIAAGMQTGCAPTW